MNLQDVIKRLFLIYKHKNVVFNLIREENKNEEKN